MVDDGRGGWKGVGEKTEGGGPNLVHNYNKYNTTSLGLADHRPLIYKI